MSGTALQVHADAPRGVAAPAADVDYGGLLNLAKELVPTGFLPDHIKTPGQAVAIILTGREMGMAPMRALRSLAMVKGKVTESADSQLARFKSDGGRALFKTLTETEAVLWLRHPNGDEHTETFTMQDAERAGLTKPSSNGTPSMFTKFPKAMLRSRVITAGLKSIGWEGGTGTYDPDELAPMPAVVVPADEAPRDEREPITDDQRAAFARYLDDPRVQREVKDRVRPRVERLTREQADVWLGRLQQMVESAPTAFEPTRPVAEVSDEMYQGDAEDADLGIDDDRPARRRRSPQELGQ